MPTLPTLTVTQAQADRMIAAYGDPGDTTAQAVEKYKAWLTESIVDYVLRAEARDLHEQHNAALRDALATLRDSLPAPPPEEPEQPL